MLIDSRTLDLVDMLSLDTYPLLLLPKVRIWYSNCSFQYSYFQGERDLCFPIKPVMAFHLVRIRKLALQHLLRHRAMNTDKNTCFSSR